MPGFYLHYVLRKQYIEKATEQAIKDGFTQFVSLGAGFDTLAWRLSKKYPHVHFIEIDHPATSKQKVKALGNEASNLEFLAVDLAEHDLESVLTEHGGFSSDKKTFYVCEGVMMYLPPKAVEGIFSKLSRLSGTGTQFVFSALPPNGSENNNFGWLLRFAVRFLGEPLAWGIEKADISQFVTAQNYQCIEHIEDSELVTRYLPNAADQRLHKGEFMVLSEAK